MLVCAANIVLLSSGSRCFHDLTNQDQLWMQSSIAYTVQQSWDQTFQTLVSLNYCSDSFGEMELASQSAAVGCGAAAEVAQVFWLEIADVDFDVDADAHAF